MNSSLYKLYKPIRNHLRRVSIENAFFVIWAYSNLFQFKNKIPPEIEVAIELLNNIDFPARGLYEWELMLLSREVIMNGVDNPIYATRSFSRWSYFSRAINKIKEFENKVWPLTGDEKSVMKEMGRIARRQFPWQIKPNATLFFRYHRIYNNPRLSKIIEKHIGLSVSTWYITGTAIFGHLITNPKCSIDPKITIAEITKSDFDKFLSHTSASLDLLREKIIMDTKYNDEFVYSLNPLEFYPFILIGNYYYCPIPTLAAWRITSGIYFDIDKKDGEFGRNFGSAFQDYLLDISNKVLDRNKAVILPEQKYKLNGIEKDSIDMILADSSNAFFVELKTKKLSAKSRSEFLSDDSINKDFAVLADAIVQVYVTIQDYEKNLYGHFPFVPTRKIYPLIVTLEDWYIWGSDHKRLRAMVETKLTEKGIPLDYIAKTPYTVTWAQTYEFLVQILNNFTIEEIMIAWHHPDKAGHNFSQFLMSNYGKGCKFIDEFFLGEFENIFPERKK